MNNFISYLYNKMKEIDKEYNKYLEFLESPYKYGVSGEYFEKRLNEVRLQKWLLEDIINEYLKQLKKNVSRETSESDLDYE